MFFVLEEKPLSSAKRASDDLPSSRPTSLYLLEDGSKFSPFLNLSVLEV